jgi:glycosyltransferase involved in cell wall biosynthesis
LFSTGKRAFSGLLEEARVEENLEENDVSGLPVEAAPGFVLNVPAKAPTAVSKVVITSLGVSSSAGLPRLIADCLKPGFEVSHAAPRLARATKLKNLVKTFRPSRKRWRDGYERENEHRIGTWRDFSDQLRASEDVRGADAILQVGLHFNSFPADYAGRRLIYLHGTLSMILDNRHYDCSMWCPPGGEIQPWLDAEREVLAAADGILIGSQFLRDILVNRYQVAPDKVQFVGTGAPSLGEAVERDRPAATPTLLFIGKDFERKGGQVLLEAFPLVRERIPNARLDIVGPRSVKRGLSEGVVVVGRVDDRARMRELVEGASVFVLPTLHDSFGFVFLEAMSMGLPCVGTRLFAIPEIIEDKVTGLLVDPGDAKQLAEAIVAILDDPAAAQEMGRRGRQRALSQFQWESVGMAIGQAVTDQIALVARAAG